MQLLKRSTFSIEESIIMFLKNRKKYGKTERKHKTG